MQQARRQTDKGPTHAPCSVDRSSAMAMHEPGPVAVRSRAVFSMAAALRDVM
jgi:hypothetical protein